ncbi:MAG: DUF2339 domain-containing protein [Nitrospiraceae bacterium]|nr:DUF2339 domain-containing protein [Nitrospiraceae bacterium]
MDPNRRIEELEQQVRDLTGLVEGMASGREVSKEEVARARRMAAQHASAKAPAPHALSEDLRRSVDMVIGGDPGETIETRIGSVWLSRIAVVLLATALVLGAQYTLSADFLRPLDKIGVLYGASLLALIYGFVWWRKQDFFSQTVLGAGLAGLYYASYAAFFVESLAVFEPRPMAALLLIACFALSVFVSHRRKSQKTAGLALFVVYYTAIAGCMTEPSAENLAYALITCAALAVVAVMFHAAHRWRIFTWVALLTTYGAYIYFFFRQPPALPISERDYFWLSNGFLTLCYAAFSLACIADVRRTDKHRRTVAPLAGLNSIVYFTLTWMAFGTHYPDQEWMFRTGAAVAMLGFAFLAETSGAHRNYIVQIFVAKAVILLSLAFESLLSGHQLVVALALECLGLALIYKRSGVVVFKVLGLLLLAFTFVGCLFEMKAPGAYTIAQYEIPARWLCCVGTATVFVIVAWFYEQFVSRWQPERRAVSGHWFLADTFLDARSATVAMLHAAAAAFILLTFTIIEFGDSPALPYLLATEAVLMGSMGFLFATPQVEVGGVLLLVAAHVCYHTFLAIGLPGFEQQAYYIPYTIALALFTYAGAYFWERYLRRTPGGNAWEHHFVAAVPYLVATFMLTTFIGRTMMGMDKPMVQAALGVALLVIGAITQYPGIKASGILAFAIATATNCSGLYASPESYALSPDFLPRFALVLGTYALGERLLVILQRQERIPSATEDHVRTLIVLAAVALGALGLYRYAPPGRLTLYWILLAVSVLAVGAIFRESRYRWTALLLLAASIVRAFAYDLRRLEPLYAFLSFAGLSLALLAITWAYSHYRRKRPRRDKGAPTHA